MASSPPQKKARTSPDKVDPPRGSAAASELDAEVQQLKLTDLPTSLLVANIFPSLKRTEWNNFSMVNRDVHDSVESHDALLPPWPDNCKIMPQGPHCDLECPIWSPDGRTIACLDAYQIHIFDQRRGHIKSWEAHSGYCYISSMTHSPDGRLLVSSSDDGRVKIWDCSNEYECIQDWRVRAADDTKVAFSPDSKLVAVFTCELIGLFCVEDGTVVKSCPLDFEMGDISNVVFSPDGHSVIFGGFDNASGNGVIKVWRIDRANDVLISVNAADGDAVQDLAISADGSNVASASYDGNLQLWKLTTEGLECTRTFEGRSFTRCSVSFTPDKIFLVVATRGAERSIRFLKLEDGTWSSVCRTDECVTNLKCSPDGSRILVQEGHKGIYLKSLRPVQNGRISPS